MSEFALELLFDTALAFAAVGLSALFALMWRALLRMPLVMISIGVGLLAFMGFLVGEFSRTSMSPTDLPPG